MGRGGSPQPVDPGGRHVNAVDRDDAQAGGPGLDARGRILIMIGTDRIWCRTESPPTVFGRRRT
jgi:hypothetical protein